MAATKINLTKTIITNVVQGRSYKKFSTQKYVIRKFCVTRKL